jgi:PRTRC genetic system protein E
MEFFEKLQREISDVDITIRIMGKNGTLTVNVMPGSANSTTPPVLMTGTGAEIDATIMSAIAETEVTAALTTNIGKAKKIVDEEVKTTNSDPKPAPKKVVKEKNKATTPAGSLFDEPEPEPDENDQETESQD